MGGKAPALAHYVGRLIGEPARGLKTNILTAEGAAQEGVADAISNADLILDASASVAVSRHISDLTGATRRVSIFFNPEGSAIVLLAESADRGIKLHDLEAQYHRLIQTRSDLSAHLRVSGVGLRYSGSCRAVTNRIPASSAALLGAIASRAVVEAAKVPSARVSIWTGHDDLSVSLSHEDGEAVERITLVAWVVSYGASVVKEIAQIRTENLPNETGGVLLGIVDTSRQTIQIVRAIAAPMDSTGSVHAFDRGVVGLADAVNEASERSLYQVRYVGAWHSHPAGSSMRPSATDIRQMCWLTEELRNEDLPALMGIRGWSAPDSGLNIADARSTSGRTPRQAVARARQPALQMKVPLPEPRPPPLKPCRLLRANGPLAQVGRKYELPLFISFPKSYWRRTQRCGSGWAQLCRKRAQLRTLKPR